MPKKIQELEEITELLSLGIAKEREAFEYYTKIYGKCRSSCDSETVQALLELLEQKKKNEIELRKQLNAIRLRLIQLKGQKIEKSILINAPPEKVFFLLSNREQIPKWNKLIKEGKVTSKEKTGVGSTVHYIGSTLGEWEVETTEWVEDQKYSERTTTGDVTMLVTATLKEVDEGTELTFELRYELPYSFLGKLVDRLKAGRELESGVTTALNNLRQLSEKDPQQFWMYRSSKTPREEA